MEKIYAINKVIQDYFVKNLSANILPAKYFMPYFIQAGIFEKDSKNGKPIRDLLRKLDARNELHLIPYVLAERKVANTNWFFQKSKTTTTQSNIQALTQTKKVYKSTIAKVSKNRDEDYVLDLCDDVLGLKGSRQHQFDFLQGDSGRKLPVDCYYHTLQLVIEYRETQHTNAVIFFDKPDKLTVSGVSRGEQRKLYDQRRRDVLPQNNIALIEIDYSDFEYDKRNKIVRDREKDLEVVRNIITSK